MAVTNAGSEGTRGVTEVPHEERVPVPEPITTKRVVPWRDDPEQLYRAHVRAIHSYFAVRLGDDLAEELTAQTFVEAWARRRSYDPELGSTRKWIYGVASHVLYHHYRQERRRAAAHVALSTQRRLASLLEAVEEEVCEVIAAAERVTKIDRAMKLIEPADQEVVVLSARQGATYEDVAGVLGVPVGTVRSRLSRARRRLAAHIGYEECEF